MDFSNYLFFLSFEFLLNKPPMSVEPAGQWWTVPGKQVLPLFPMSNYTLASKISQTSRQMQKYRHLLCGWQHRVWMQMLWMIYMVKQVSDKGNFGLSIYPLLHRREAGYTLGMSPVYRRANTEINNHLQLHSHLWTIYSRSFACLWFVGGNRNTQRKLY